MATDPVGPFPLSDYWDTLPFGGYPGCVPLMPPGASDQALESITVVAANGFDPGKRTRSGDMVLDGSRRGEDLPCGEISCGTAEVIVPTGKVVLRVDRFASEAVPNPNWQADPYTTIGWCGFTDLTRRTLPSGDLQIRATLKNWSEDRVRQLLLRVWLKA